MSRPIEERTMLDQLTNHQKRFYNLAKAIQAFFQRLRK